MTFTVGYDNDTGPGDDYFDEWWTVEIRTAGVHLGTIRCETERQAEMLAQRLTLMAEREGRYLDLKE